MIRATRFWDAVSYVVMRCELRARKFPPENRAQNISWYIHEKRRERASWGGGEFIGKKYCIRASRRWKSERKRREERGRVKDDEEVILYLLWHDHRPLRIVNVGDCEYHRLWDIGGWEARASEEIPR